MVDNKTLKAWTGGIIGLVVLFLIAAELLPEAFAAGESLNDTGMPLGNFFIEGGVVWVIVGAAIVMLVVYLFLGTMGHRKK